MFRGVVAVAALGVGAYIAYELFRTFVLPLLGMVLGLAMFLLKLVLVALAIVLLFRLLKRWNGRSAAAA